MCSGQDIWERTFDMSSPFVENKPRELERVQLQSTGPDDPLLYPPLVGGPSLPGVDFERDVHACVGGRAISGMYFIETGPEKEVNDKMGPYLIGESGVREVVAKQLLELKEQNGKFYAGVRLIYAIMYGISTPTVIVATNTQNICPVSWS
ncbi:hypothetical protein BBJ29_004401 [Phytophthora kernoviae]|uniref:Uncharacterized protein n=1 Tax=Phytophthora kernoviae TaxID=325452 RepID=A0A3R7JD61_9STRA|nr:hypothetical protein BBJ29_004401 [Phytophthora kernoviae]